MRKRWLMVALSMIVCSMFLLSGCKEKIYTSGDFIYRLNGGQLFLEGLSEQGKEKETIVIPKEIDGYKVKELTYQYGLSVRGGNFESEKLKQIYIIPSMELWRISFSNVPNLTKIIMVGAYSDIYDIDYGNAEIFFSTIENHDYWEADERGCIPGTQNVSHRWLSNCNYFYNYEGAENDGHYWSDNYDYGEKITYVPQNPEREGYIFGGWFQEPECVNIWNFETDTLPEAKYNEEGEALYQETRLYAKWYAEQ